MARNFNAIAVVGGGFVGVAYALVLARYGYRVVLYDRDVDRIRELQSGKIPFYDKSLWSFLEGNKEVLYRVSFTSELSRVLDVDLCIVCIGTYVQGRYSDENLFSFFNDLDEIHDKVFIVKSTVKPGTTRKIKEVLERKGCAYGRDFYLIYNPEFLREGSSIYDVVNPSKIVAGINYREEGEVVERLYSFVPSNVPRVYTNWETAELIKLAQNAFLVMKISFANDLMYIAWEHGWDIDFKKLAEALSLDPRIGSYGLYPGLGFGGSCLPKDARLLAELEKEAGYRLIQEAVRINDENVERIIRRLEEKYGELRNKKVLIVGLSFKEGTDDLRDSPALELARKLKEKGNTVYWYDEDIKEAGEIEGIKPFDLSEKYDFVLITKSVEAGVPNMVNAERFISLRAYLNYFGL